MNRRTFLKGAALSAVALRMGASLRPVVAAPAIIAPEFPALTTQLLNLVNSERAAAGVTSLKLDRLACTVAEKHATEMARHNFLSHWGLDGRKPYHRYSFAGGFEAVHENAGSINTPDSIIAEEIPEHVTWMHRSMHDEKPPHDGHRRTILDPNHTHVGFGFADYGYCVRLCELYLARYLTIDAYKVTASPGSRFILSGRLLSRKYSIEGIHVLYEPLPTPPAIAWLRIPRPYGLPDDPKATETLMPKLPPKYSYRDGTNGSIDVLGDGRFQVPIRLSRKQSGIYTIVVWIRRSPNETPFQATHVCVRAE